MGVVRLPGFLDDSILWDRLSMRTVSAAASLVPTIAFAACGGAPVTTYQSGLTHPTGLRAPLPTAFTQVSNDAGFVFVEAGDLRSPLTLEIELRDAPPTFASAKERWLSRGDVAVYRVSELAGGSGGVEYELVATKPAGARWIVVTAFQQAQGAAPRFETAWGVLDRAGLAAEAE